MRVSLGTLAGGQQPHLQNSLKGGTAFLRPLSGGGVKGQAELYSDPAHCQETQGEKRSLRPGHRPCPAGMCRCDPGSSAQRPLRMALCGETGPRDGHSLLQSVREAPEERPDGGGKATQRVAWLTTLGLPDMKLAERNPPGSPMPGV